MEFEGSGSKGTRVIERKRSVTDGQTDGQSDGQTDKAKTICLPQRGGDIILHTKNVNADKILYTNHNELQDQHTIYV